MMLIDSSKQTVNYRFLLLQYHIQIQTKSLIRKYLCTILLFILTNIRSRLNILTATLCQMSIGALLLTNKLMISLVLSGSALMPILPYSDGKMIFIIIQKLGVLNNNEYHFAITVR